MTGTVCFKQKKLIFVLQNLGDLEANGEQGSKFQIKYVVFGFANPDLPIHYATITLLSIFG